MKKYIITVSLISIGILLGSLKDEKITIEKNTPLSVVLQNLGEQKPLHSIEKIDPALAKKGKEIFFSGRTIDSNGKKTKIQSKFFTCNNCHNVVKEDPNPAVSDPEARLEYAIENKLPFLQGTTLYGVVNRESWYNEDYLKKYGDLVKDSRDTLINAIQLCATTCSQGRALTDWEMKAFLHYLWSIEIKLRDLNLDPKDYEKLNRAMNNEQAHAETLKWLKSRYLQASPATFADPSVDKAKKEELQGSPVLGEAIYKLSCQQCHWHNKVSDFVLDDAVQTFRFLERKVDSETNSSVFNVVRKGTYPIPGHRPYMPQYTLERMSSKQLFDLIAYIEEKSGKHN